MTPEEQYKLDCSKDPEFVANARRCTICGSGADKRSYGFQCQQNSGHKADRTTGIFSDLSYDQLRAL